MAGLLGLECARIEVGTYNSRIGSMSYLINNKKEILIGLKIPISIVKLNSYFSDYFTLGCVVAYDKNIDLGYK